MRRLLLIILILAGCTRTTLSEAPAAPIATPDPAPSVAPVSPVIKKAHQVLVDASNFAAEPTVSTGLAIHTLELTARLRKDVHVARARHTQRALDQVDHDIVELRQAMQETP